MGEASRALINYMSTNNKNQTSPTTILCQEYLLKLLKYFHSLCVKHDIKYTLEAGTLLGAVRDKGFIPWDDDADVSLIRKEYDKLLDVLRNEKLPDDINVYFPEDKKEFFDFTVRIYYKGRKVRTDESTSSHYDALYSYATLDIFVMDNIPKQNIKKKIYVALQKLTYGLAMSKRHKITIKKYSLFEKLAISIFSTFGKCFSLKTIFNLHNTFSKMYKDKNTDLLYCTTWSPIFSSCTYDSKYYESVHLTPFEDTELYVIDHYDEVLTIGYGDWKTPVKTHDHDNIVDNI